VGIYLKKVFKKIKEIIPDSILRTHRLFSMVLIIFLLAYFFTEILFFINSRKKMNLYKNLLISSTEIKFVQENLLTAETLLFKSFSKDSLFTHNRFTDSDINYKKRVTDLLNISQKTTKRLIRNNRHDSHENKLQEVLAIIISLRNDIQDIYKTGLNDKLEKNISKNFHEVNSLLGKIDNEHVYYQNDYFQSEKIKERFRLIVFIITTVLIMLVIFLVFFVNKTIHNKISFLTDSISQTSGINEFEKIEYDPNDEIKPVISKFNSLMQNISRTTDELSHTKNYLENLIESSPSMIVGIDKNGRVNHWNKTTENYTGISKEEALNKHFWILHPILRKYKKYYNEVINKNKKILLDKEIFTNGKTRYNDVKIFPLLGKDNKGAVLRIEDITELEKKKEQLRRSQKLESLGTLAGGIAHDFNNFLFGILGYIDLVKRNLKKDSRDYKNLLKAKKAGKRAKELIHQILTFSRGEEERKRIIQIQTVLKEIMKLIENIFPSSIKIKYKIESDCPPVKSDPVRIHEMVMNLATNALHAMDDKGTLKIKLKSEKISANKKPEFEELSPGLYVKLIVKDDGCGMSEDVKEKIFEPYFTTKKSEGTGLGLSVVHGIVKESNGKIFVKSEPNVGSEFIIYLPGVNEKAEKEIEEKDEINTKTYQGKILYVDDEKMILDIAEQKLKLHGFDVDTFDNPVFALREFKEQKDEYDLVITDFIMPNYNGDELAAQIRKINENIPIIFVTGYSNKTSQKDLDKNKIEKIFYKPINYNELIDFIDKFI